jgi:hypothetical protein
MVAAFCNFSTPEFDFFPTNNADYTHKPFSMLTGCVSITPLGRSVQESRS